VEAQPDTDGRSHDGMSRGPHDHHPQPVSFPISSEGVVSLPPGTTYDLEIALPAAGFQFATIHLEGPRRISPGSTTWRESAQLFVTRNSAEASSKVTIREAAFKKTYHGSYQKQAGNSYLTHKIFDSNTSTSARYIAVQDSWINDTHVVIRFRNFFGGSAFLWCRGQGLAY